MKTPLIISTLSAAIILTPAISFANSDDGQYPAANFQPTIIYQDKNATKALRTLTFHGEKSVFDPQYPAANFEPKVIYP